MVTITVPNSDMQVGGTVAENEAIASTEAYETEEGVVLYDAERPLAWIQSDAAVDREEMV